MGREKERKHKLQGQTGWVGTLAVPFKNCVFFIPNFEPHFPYPHNGQDNACLAMDIVRHEEGQRGKSHNDTWAAQSQL